MSAFKTHLLNADGIAKAKRIGQAFGELEASLSKLCPVPSREMSIVMTKLEEACFFAKKSIAEAHQLDATTEYFVNGTRHTTMSPELTFDDVARAAGIDPALCPTTTAHLRIGRMTEDRVVLPGDRIVATGGLHFTCVLTVNA